MDRHPTILNAASNMLGICFVIIAGLRLTDSNSRSFADEIAWLAAICFLASISLSYATMRREGTAFWQAIWAERLFMAGVASLTLSTVVLAVAVH